MSVSVSVSVRGEGVYELDQESVFSPIPFLCLSELSYKFPLLLPVDPD